MWTNGPLAQAQYVPQQQSILEAAQSSTWTQQGGEDARAGTHPNAESTGFYAWPPPMPLDGESANMIRMATDYPRSYAEAVEGGKQKIYVYRKPQDLPIIKSEVITDSEAITHETFQDTGVSANVISHNLFVKW